MKCPRCGYIHGFEMDDDENKLPEGSDGGFYTLPVCATRSKWGERDEVGLYVCPSCMSVFGKRWV